LKMPCAQRYGSVNRSREQLVVNPELLPQHGMFHQPGQSKIGAPLAPIRSHPPVQWRWLSLTPKLEAARPVEAAKTASNCFVCCVKGPTTAWAGAPVTPPSNLDLKGSSSCPNGAVGVSVASTSRKSVTLIWSAYTVPKNTFHHFVQKKHFSPRCK
jgi:hypothetical protein